MATCGFQGCDRAAGWDCPNCNLHVCHEHADNEVEDPRKSKHAWCRVCGGLMERRDDAPGPPSSRTKRQTWNSASDDHSKEMWLIQDFIEKLGGKAWQMPQNPTELRGHKGVPDMEACVPVGKEGQRRWIWIKIEVKVGRDTPSDEQEAYREWCQKAAVPHVFGGVKDVETLIDNLWRKHCND